MKRVSKTLALDYEKVASSFDKTFYYDALPPKKRGEEAKDHEGRKAKKQLWFDRLKLTPRVHVKQGTAKGEGKKARQKGVDMLIAIDMLTFSYKHIMDRATFIAGDEDFAPLIGALVQEGMHVDVWYNPHSISKELLFAADGAYPLLTARWTLTNLDSIIAEFARPPAEQRVSKSNNVRFVAEHPPVKQGKLHTDEPVTLHEKDDMFVAAIEDWSQPNTVRRVTCRELELLEKYMRYDFGEFSWD